MVGGNGCSRVLPAYAMPSGGASSNGKGTALNPKGECLASIWAPPAVDADVEFGIFTLALIYLI